MMRLQRGYVQTTSPEQTAVRAPEIGHFFRAFISMLVALGVYVLGRAIVDLPAVKFDYRLPILAVLMMASGRFAIKELKADTLLLDDGLQYLHLKHRLYIVLIDRQAPFGNEHLLPRGTLREPPRNLRRASYIFITKSTAEPNDALIKRIRRYNRTAEIIECSHQPLHLENVQTGEQIPLERLRDTYIGSLCGIAAPESFEEGLGKLGARLELTKRYTDHHRYSEAELQSFINRCIRRDLEMIVTTEKDAVRFPPLGKVDVPIYFLRVEIEILSGHESWEHCVARICKPQPMLSPARFFA
jgi:tetraacyldisaccharide 4'-kinase